MFSTLEIQSGKITLTTLTNSKIELLRYWRNQRSNNQFLINKQEITKEAQQVWFNKTQQTNDLYFIIQYNNKDVGLIYTSKTDLKNKTVETNILIGEEDYKKSGIALKCSLLFTNYLLNEGGFRTLKSVVKRDHSEGLRIDYFIGFEPYKEEAEFVFLSLDLTKFKKSKGYQLYQKLISINPINIIA